MVSITDNAVSRFRTMLEDSNTEDHGIRIYAAGGG